MPRIDPAQLGEVDLQKVLSHLIEEHETAHTGKLQSYYEGTHDILNRQMTDATKPNNKIVNNLARLITDTITGYFMGKPVSYSTDEDNEAYLERLQEILDENDEQDHNSELGKSMSIKGAAYELLYTDEDARIKFAELERQNVIYVKTDDVAEECALAVRIYEVDDIIEGKRYFYDVYTDDEIVTYEKLEEHGNKSYVERDRQEHYFKAVPVIEYSNNKELLGDFEGVMSLIDAYNIAQSDTANDFEYFTDAYLKLTGAGIDDETSAKMKEQRIINLPDREADAEWLIKDINDTAVENYKQRLREDIHMLSGVPNLTDDQFAGQLSGVAIAYKIWGMEQIASTKERKFKRSLQRRIELITNILTLNNAALDWRVIDMSFSRNMPEHLVEIVDMVQKLQNIVSRKTLLGRVPFVEDPQAEMDLLEEEDTGIDLDEVEPLEEEDDES